MSSSNSLTALRHGSIGLHESKGSPRASGLQPALPKAIDKEAALTQLARWLEGLGDDDLIPALPIHMAVQHAIDAGQTGITLHYDGRGPDLRAWGFALNIVPVHQASLWSTASSSQGSSDLRVANPSGRIDLPTPTSMPTSTAKIDQFIRLASLFKGHQATVDAALDTLTTSIREQAAGDAEVELQMFSDLAFQLNVLARHDQSAAPLVSGLFKRLPAAVQMLDPSVSAYGPDIRAVMASIDAFVKNLPLVCTAQTQRECEALMASFRAQVPVREPRIRENSLHELLALEMHRWAESNRDRLGTVQILFGCVPEKFQYLRPGNAHDVPPVPTFRFGSHLDNIARMAERLPTDLTVAGQNEHPKFSQFANAVNAVRAFIAKDTAGMQGSMTSALDAGIEQCANLHPSIGWKLRSYKSLPPD
ncbi:hypothetical protein BH11PSE7_BH11PSE7_38360 [soil metagenome]